jgi:serine/threonine-protein kinase
MSPLTKLRVRALPALLLLVVPQGAFAETNATQRAAAEALFQQGTTLMDERRFAEACDKFAGSQEMDPALGTMLYLADCYEQAGRTASAWALFKEASQTAKHASQPERERIATERAASLEQRLSKLELRVAPGRSAPGLELLLNDVAVPRASWNAPIPVDPGPTRLKARAPGKKTWATELEVTPGPASQTIDVAALENAPAAPARALSAAPAPSTDSTQRIVGYVIGAAGLVALGAGGFLGYRAYSLNKDSKGECRASDANACTANGVAMREEAQTAGTLATILTASGGALVIGGVTLVVTAPSSVDSDSAKSVARASLPGVGLVARGVW